MINVSDRLSVKLKPLIFQTNQVSKESIFTIYLICS